MEKVKPGFIKCIILMSTMISLTACGGVNTPKTLSPVDVPGRGHQSSTIRKNMGKYKGEKYQVCEIAIAKGDKAKIAEVIGYCDKQLAIEPDNDELYYIKAMAHSQLGDIDNAMKAVIKAVDKGTAFERFLAGPRNMFAALTGSKKFRDYAASYNVELIHGPMLGDVTASSVKIWVRTAHELPVAVRYSQNADMAGAVLSKAVKTDADADFTALVNLTGLKSNTVYYYQVVIDGKAVLLDQKLSFTTAPANGAPAKFKVAFGGGSNIIPRNEYMWDTILSYRPAAMLQLGDNTYFNIPDVTEHQQYFFYRRHSRPEYKRMIASVPVYAIWDDHDFGGNDSIGTADKFKPYWKHEIVLPQFMYNFNNPYYGGADDGPGCWFDFSIGDVDFFMLDGRYYRTDPQKPNPSMLGAAQLKWLLAKLRASTATFKIIASPVPWAFGAKVGKQRSATLGSVPGAQDTWEGFPDEREKIFALLEDNKIEGVYLISADRHRSDAWRIERPNGYDLYEASTSHLTKKSTHSKMPNAIFSILGKPAFGLLTIDTTLADPQITYDVMKIDGEKSATLTVKLSQLKFNDKSQPVRAGKVRSADAEPVAFGDNGQLNMLYDARQRPQAVYLNGKVHIVFAGRTDAPDEQTGVGDRYKIKTGPMLITYDPAVREFSKTLTLGRGTRNQHHTPIIWADELEYLHILFGCHGNKGTHLISKLPAVAGDSMDSWSKAPQIGVRMSYPTLFRIYDNRELIHYRTGGHSSSWTYRISGDNGKTWQGPANDVTDMDKDFEKWPEWSSYQTKLPSSDGRSLYVCFTSYDDVKSNDPKRLYNPRYKKPVRNEWKYNLYLIKIDLKTLRVTNFQGQTMQTPIDIEQANAKCRIWDTDWRGAGVPPAIKLDRNGNPAFLHVLSGDTLKEHKYYYVRYVGGKWKKTPITFSNHQWNSCYITDGTGGSLDAYIITNQEYLAEEGYMDRHGGGQIEQWTSEDDGNSWKKTRDLTPDKTRYPGWKFNNIQPVKKPDGTVVENMLLFYGWKDGNAPTAKAFLLHE